METELLFFLEQLQTDKEKLEDYLRLLHQEKESVVVKLK